MIIKSCTGTLKFTFFLCPARKYLDQPRWCCQNLWLQLGSLHHRSCESGPVWDDWIHAPWSSDSKITWLQSRCVELRHIILRTNIYYISSRRCSTVKFHSKVETITKKSMQSWPLNHFPSTNGFHTKLKFWFMPCSQGVSTRDRQLDRSSSPSGWN